MYCLWCLIATNANTIIAIAAVRYALHCTLPHQLGHRGTIAPEINAVILVEMYGRCSCVGESFIAEKEASE